MANILVDETKPASGSKRAKRLSQFLVKSKLIIFLQKFDDPRKDQRMNNCYERNKCIGTVFDHMPLTGLLQRAGLTYKHCAHPPSRILRQQSELPLLGKNKAKK